ncbi:suppressor of fused domain protein [Dactylosporangium sp. McL0621]|uniref:suppressor of fused domain protein n=1 Tax=Dactylosporangium sp. McL0621 TaxID=3415678 RepID=UPI003CF2292C
MDHELTPAARALLEHLRARFPGRKVAVLPPAPGPIRDRVPGLHILRLDPEDGGRLYVTSGVWDATQHDGEGLEFLLYAPEPADEQHAETLSMVAYYHAGGGGGALDHGHTVPIGRPWAGASECDHLLVSLPYPWGPALEECPVPGGRARLLWLLPVTEAEKTFRHARGLEALERRFESAGINPVDPGRASVVDAAVDRVGRPDVEVLEGRLTEAPTRDATGVERRAFGEFVGPRGELASYAFGWTTGADPHVGRLTIGIGAGNPGGGTFHATVLAHEGDSAFALSDEPFERVPQGGPDLTAGQARAHEDLQFVWWVADQVMERDRRARWMWHWLLGTSAIQAGEVFEGREPVLYVSHDADDGLWQLIGATGVDPATARVAHLHHVVDEDPTLLDVLGLPPGDSARRTGPGAPWIGGTA